MKSVDFYLWVGSVCKNTCLPPSIQLSYRRQRHKEVNTLTTANSTAELTLPEDDDDYIIHIQTLSEGGLGPASEPIRIHQLSKLVVHGCRGQSSESSWNNLARFSDGEEKNIDIFSIEP